MQMTPVPIWSPSTSIETAWEVVGKFCVPVRNPGDDHWETSVYYAMTHGTWTCSINFCGSIIGESTAPSAPLAICLAALKAVGAD